MECLSRPWPVINATRPLKIKMMKNSRLERRYLSKQLLPICASNPSRTTNGKRFTVRSLIRNQKNQMHQIVKPKFTPGIALLSTMMTRLLRVYLSRVMNRIQPDRDHSAQGTSKEKLALRRKRKCSSLSAIKVTLNSLELSAKIANAWTSSSSSFTESIRYTTQALGSTLPRSYPCGSRMYSPSSMLIITTIAGTTRATEYKVSDRNTSRKQSKSW